MSGIALHDSLVRAVMNVLKFQDPLEYTTRTLTVDALLRQYYADINSLQFESETSQLCVYYPKAPIPPDVFYYQNAEVTRWLHGLGVRDLGRFVDGLLYYQVSGDNSGLVATRCVYPVLRVREFKCRAEERRRPDLFHPTPTQAKRKLKGKDKLGELALPEREKLD